MIVPAAIMPKAEDIRDPADIPKPDPQLHDKQNPLLLREGELIICKDDPISTGWYVTEVWKVLPGKIEVKYLSTRTPNLENYPDKTVDQVKPDSNKHTSGEPGSLVVAKIMERVPQNPPFQTTLICGSGQDPYRIENIQLYCWSAPLLSMVLV